MDLDQNPIFLLGMRALLPEALDWQQIMDKAESPEFLASIEEKYCDEVAEVVEAIKDKNLYHALLFSKLNIFCAIEIKANKKIRGHIALAHGTALSISGELDEALEFLELARQLFKTEEMPTAVASCDMNIANVYAM